MNNKRRFRRTKLGGFVTITILLFCGVYALVGVLITSSDNDQIPNENQNFEERVYYEIQTDKTSKISLLWVTDNIITNNVNYGDVKIAFVDKKLFVLGSKGTNSEQTLLTLDMLTGEPVSLNAINDTYYDSRGTTFLSHSNMLLLGVNGTQKISGDITWGAGKIIAFDTDAGTQVWETVIPGARSINTLTTCGSTIGVSGSFANSDYVLSMVDGDIIKKTPKSQKSLIWTIEDGIEYRVSDDSSFAAFTEANGYRIWTSSIREPIYQPILCIDDLFLIRSHRSTQIGNIFLVDKTTGSVLWSFHNVVSNVAMSNDQIFAFTKNMELVVIDRQSGKVIDKVSFSSTNGLSNEERHAFVVADDDKVYVYVSESNQIFAFELEATLN